MKLHDGEIDITLDLARRLLFQQFPHYANLPLAFLNTQGTDNIMFALGNDKVMRLPRTENAAFNLEKEADILAQLKDLPVAIPDVFDKGQASDFYPFSWLICSKLSGQAFKGEKGLDHDEDAHHLAAFIKAFQTIPVKEGASQSLRGQGLHVRHDQMLKTLPLMADIYDVKQLSALWQESIEAPVFEGKPVWTHSDLHLGNVLIGDNGALSGVVDFGMAGVGDPSVDLMAAWTIFEPKARKIFKESLVPSEDMWLRAKGWALSMGVIAYPYYKDRYPYFANIAKRAIDQILSDVI